MEWYLKAMRQFADFEGRARRTEYWMFTLFYMLMLVATIFLMMIGGDAAATMGSILFFGVAIVHIIPGISVAVRRLHDTGKSGWLYLVGFIPLVGSIILLVFFCTEGQVGPNEYGSDPKDFDIDAPIDGVLDDI